MSNKYKEVAINEFNGMFSVILVAEKIQHQRLYYASKDITEAYQKAFEAVQVLNNYNRFNN